MKTQQFPNGFTVIYDKPNSFIPLTSIATFVRVGSVYEPQNLKGVCHFIEHMCVKGTKNKPTQKSITNFYDKIGAYFNAYTEKEYTCYQLKCQNDDLKEALYNLVDLLLNSIFKKEDYKKEYQVIMEENMKDEDDNENIINEKINSLLYEGTSYAEPVDRLVNHKNKLKYQDVLDFYHLFYQPENMVLSIVTQTPFSTIKHLLENSFFILQKKNPTKLQLIHPIVNIMFPSSLQCKIYKKPNLNVNYLCISFRTCSYHNNDQYSLYLLSQILCGTFSSLLYSLLRDENGLTYSSSADVNFYEYFGDLSIYIILNPTKLLKNGKEKGVLPLVIDLLNHLYEKGISEKDFTIIKGYVKGQFLIDSEDSLYHSEYNGKKILFNGGFTPFHKIYSTHYHPLKKENIDAIIRKYFKKINMSCILMGTTVPSHSIFEKQCNQFVG